MILIGVALEILATVAGTIGKQLLRYSKMLEGTQHKAHASTALCVGMLTNVLAGPIIEVAAYGQAPQTLLAPLMGLDVLWNILLVPYTLGEIPSRTQFAGCCLLVGGAALTALTGPHTEEPYTLDVMRDRLLTDNALSYILAEVVVFTIGTLYMQRRPYGDKKRGLVLGCVAGGIGGNLFFMKAAASLISASWSGGLTYVFDVWTTDPLPLLVAASAMSVGGFSAVLLAKGMREFEATMMVATYEGAVVVSGCASGVSVLGELDHISPSRRTWYTVGVLIVVIGVICAQEGQEIERALSPPTTPLSQVRQHSGRSNGQHNGQHCLLAAADAPLLKAYTESQP